MSPTWLALALLLPPVAAAAAAVAVPRPTPPRLAIALNAALPGSGLATLGRPLLEVVLGVLLAQISLVLVGRPADLPMYLPFALVGGAWAALYTPLSPLRRLAGAGEPTAAVPPPAAVAAPAAPAPRAGDAAEEAAEEEYAVTVRCTECGADVEVPVLQRAARCSFCGSRHLVVGHDEVLHLALPERAAEESSLRAALLDHYRYLHYVELYQRHVAPLERQATTTSPEGAMVTRPELRLAAAAAEQRVTARADAYRSKLERELQVTDTLRFLAPYRHGMGTLYQAAFGRGRGDQEKRLAFAVGTVEASALACTDVALPEMGHLSYLRALVPAARHLGRTAALALAPGEEMLERAYGDLDRKQLVRHLQVIRLGAAFVPEVRAVVWRTFWLATVRGGGHHERVLVDAAGGSVRPAPILDAQRLGPLPEEVAAAGTNLRFAAMECPVCGDEFPFEADAVLQFCGNCHRLFGVRGGRKLEVAYDRVPAPASSADLLPFWRFPLSLRTADGEWLRTLGHLRDGIDGTLDQIGEVPAGQDDLYVPALRFRNAKLMARAFNRLLLYTLERRPTPLPGRFPLDERPALLPVCLDEAEARRLAPLYLASAFNRRDLARVNVHQVERWLFQGRLESHATLTYVPVPRPVTEPFRAYVGRHRAAAVAAATRPS